MKLTRGKVFAAVGILVIIGVVMYTANLSNENKSLSMQLEEIKRDPNSVNKEQIQELTSLLSKLVALPQDEEPVVATVTDKEKLKDQPVFAKAENGDKILIYAKAAKAYVYRPSTNLLIDVLPVNIGNQQTMITGVDENTPLRIALVNGSKNEGITGVLEKRLEERNFPGVTVVSKAMAKSDAYEKTVVYDITGKYSQQAGEIASLVSGSVITETAEGLPNADIMIIVGADFQ